MGNEKSNFNQTENTIKYNALIRRLWGDYRGTKGGQQWCLYMSTLVIVCMNERNLEFKVTLK